MDSQFCKHMILAMFLCCSLTPGNKQALHVRNNTYLLLSYASIPIKYWCAHSTTLQAAAHQ